MSNNAQNQVYVELAIATALDLIQIALKASRGGTLTEAEEKAVHDAVNATAVRLAAAAEARAKDAPAT
jgi:hypothetical protein